MKKNSLYNISYGAILSTLRTYKISFISLLTLIIAFLFWEELYDILELILIFNLILEFDFLMLYTKIKTPFNIKFFGAVLAEIPVILAYLRLLKISSATDYFLALLMFIAGIGFLFESERILPNKIDWYGNSRISQSYKKSIYKEEKKDQAISSKYFSHLWGRKIISFEEQMKHIEISKISGRGMVLYIAGGLLISFIAYYLGQFFLFIDNKFSWFVILFIIVLADIRNSYTEKQYKKRDGEKSLYEDLLIFIASVFRSKVPYFYLSIALFNFMIIFSVIAVALILGADTISYFLKSAYIKNAVIIASTEFKVNSPIMGYLLYILALVFYLSYILLPFLVYLNAHHRILKNFARRYNYQKPLNYQSYQEILIFISINYLFFSLFLIKDNFSFIFSLALFLIPLILSILLILNYKFGKKTPLTEFREHIIWLTLLPGLILLVKEFGIGKNIIFIFYSMLLLSVILRRYFISHYPKRQYSYFKNVIVVILMYLPLDIYIFGGSVKEAVFTTLFLFFLIIIVLAITKEATRLDALPSQKKAPSTWFNAVLGMGGPYTIDELTQLGYNLPHSKNQQKI